MKRRVYICIYIYIEFESFTQLTWSICLLLDWITSHSVFIPLPYCHYLINKQILLRIERNLNPTCRFLMEDQWWLFVYFPIQFIIVVKFCCNLQKNVNYKLKPNTCCPRTWTSWNPYIPFQSLLFLFIFGWCYISTDHYFLVQPTKAMCNRLPEFSCTTNALLGRDQ